MEQLDREEELEAAAAADEDEDEDDDGELVAGTGDCAAMFEAVMVCTGSRLISS